MNRYFTAKPVSIPLPALAAAPGAAWGGSNTTLNNADHHDADGALV